MTLAMLMMARALIFIITTGMKQGIVPMLLMNILALKGMLLLGPPIALGAVVIGHGAGLLIGKVIGSSVILYLVVENNKNKEEKEKPKMPRVPKGWHPYPKKPTPFFHHDKKPIFPHPPGYYLPTKIYYSKSSSSVDFTSKAEASEIFEVKSPDKNETSEDREIFNIASKLNSTDLIPPELSDWISSSNRTKRDDINQQIDNYKTFKQEFNRDVENLFKILSVLEIGTCLERMICDVMSKDKSLENLSSYELKLILAFKLMDKILPLNQIEKQSEAIKFRKASMLGKIYQSQDFCSKNYSDCSTTTYNIIMLGSRYLSEVHKLNQS